MTIRLKKILVLVEALVIVGLLTWLFRENQANAFMRTWLSHNFPIGPFLLGRWVVIGITAGLLTALAIWILLAEVGLPNALLRRFMSSPNSPPDSEPPIYSSDDSRNPPPRRSAETNENSRASYETMEIRTIILVVALATQGVALWFITAGLFQISGFPADAFDYLKLLPFTYWWGLAATIGLLASGRLIRGSLRTAIEILSLSVMALYLVGLPSVSYQDPRILDSFQHEGNALALYNHNGWFLGPVWYVRQFPGGFTFFAQLTAVAGLDPFQVMNYYPLGLSLVLPFFLYVVARTYSRNYAALASALFLSGIWFQLHISPQSIELIPYLSIMFILLKLVTDRARERKWGLIALAVVPSFIASHPETPIVVLASVLIFLVISLPRSKRFVLDLLPTGGSFLLGLFACFVVWWSTISWETRNYVNNTILAKAVSDLSHLAVKSSTIPTTPLFSYHLAILLEEAVSVVVWGLGGFLLLFIRRFNVRESLFTGFFLAGVSTIPIALFARADVLQRSYLFSLFPVALLTVSLLERKGVLILRGRSLSSLLKAGLFVMIIGFSVIMPITRYGVDPGQYIPSSSLAAADQASSLRNSSILFLSPGDYAWRFYAALNGGIEGPKVEQANIAHRPGGYTKPTSAFTDFNLTFSKADTTADYIIISDYYENLYILRYGNYSVDYQSQKSFFETQTALGTGFSEPFNLVFSTGTDRIYENRG